VLRVERNGAQDARELIFSPAVSLITQATAAEVNNRPVKFLLRPSPAEAHINVRVPLASNQTLVRIRLRNTFGMENSVKLPALGAASRNLKIASETWEANRLTLGLSGIAGQTYELEVFGSAQIASVEGAELLDGPAGRRLRVHFPAGSGYVRKTVGLRFAPSAAKETSRNWPRVNTDYAIKEMQTTEDTRDAEVVKLANYPRERPADARRV
jgi:hypothetical protein